MAKCRVKEGAQLGERTVTDIPKNDNHTHTHTHTSPSEPYFTISEVLLKRLLQHFGTGRQAHVCPMDRAMLGTRVLEEQEKKVKGSGRGRINFTVKARKEYFCELLIRNVEPQI